MRIVHLINYFNDKLDYQENNLIKQQSAKGHDVSLITSNQYYPFKNYDEVYLKIIGNRSVKKKKYKYFGANIIRKKILFENKKHAQCFFPYIFEILQIKPEIIHIHNSGTYNFMSIFILSFFIEFKIFIDCHQDKFNTKKSIFYSIHNQIWKIVYWLFKRKISLFLPINNSSKKFLKDCYNIPENKMKISPLGFQKFNKLSIKQKSKFYLKNKLIKNKKKQVVLINSGKQNFSKNISQLIDLTIILNKRGLNTKLILIGNKDPSYKSYLEEKIRKLKYLLGNEKVIILPMLTNKKLRYFLSISDIAIWPGTPSITIQEALYLDNLIFLPKHSPSSHLLCSDLLYFFNDNLNKTANNIIKIMNNNNIYKRVMIKNNQILKKINWLKINDDLEYFYRN